MTNTTYKPTTEEIIEKVVTIFIRTAQPVTASDVAEAFPGSKASVIGRAMASAFDREGWSRISPVTVIREVPCKSYGYMGGTTNRKVAAYVVPASHLCAIIRGFVSSTRDIYTQYEDSQ